MAEKPLSKCPHCGGNEYKIHTVIISTGHEFRMFSGRINEKEMEHTITYSQNASCLTCFKTIPSHVLRLPDIAHLVPNNTTLKR